MKNITLIKSTKSKLLLVGISLVSLGLSQAYSDDSHDQGAHDGHKHADHEGHKHDEAGAKEDSIKTPNGGKLLTSVEPHAELFVTEERKIQITFLDEDGKIIPVEEQSVSVICGDRQSPTRLSFAKNNGVLISENTLPDGDNIPAIIQIKSSSDAKKVTERINLNLAKCSTCENAEYACTCSH